MTEHSAPQAVKPLNKIQWWACFLVATYLMSLWFQASRAFFQATSLSQGITWFAVSMPLGMVLLVLIYDSYVQEKNRNHVQKSIRIFEWLMAKRFLLKGDLK